MQEAVVDCKRRLLSLDRQKQRALVHLASMKSQRDRYQQKMVSPSAAPAAAIKAEGCAVDTDTA